MLLEFDMGQISAFCYMVERGKPCAKITIHKEDLQSIEDYIKQFTKLDFYKCPSLDGEEYYTFWVYKEEYMLDVIKNLPSEPNSLYDHWVLGKAFGYSDESIKEFLGISKT